MPVTPIVEYADIEYYETGNMVNPVLLWSPERYDEDSYWGEITNRLMRENGLYVFYDSMTRPLYVGIAPVQSIWQRANQSYNNEFGWDRGIMDADHPNNNVRYRGPRRLRRVAFELNDVAKYFSAYAVAETELLRGLEAFVIRAFGGTLLNTRMEGNGGLGLPPLDEAQE